MGRWGDKIMSATLMPLGDLEQSFLSVVNFMEISYNNPVSKDYLLEPTTGCVYVVDIDFDHFGVTLMGSKERTGAFRNDLGIILEKMFREYGGWQSNIQLI
jgi:hypothetical protein